MNVDLTDEEHAAPLRLVKQAIDEDRCLYAHVSTPLKSILAKLEPRPWGGT
jgi:hypothetical protein